MIPVLVELESDDVIVDLMILAKGMVTSYPTYIPNYVRSFVVILTSEFHAFDEVRSSLNLVIRRIGSRCVGLLSTSGPSISPVSYILTQIELRAFNSHRGAAGTGHIQQRNPQVNMSSKAPFEDVVRPDDTQLDNGSLSYQTSREIVEGYIRSGLPSLPVTRANVIYTLAPIRDTSTASGLRLLEGSEFESDVAAGRVNIEDVVGWTCTLIGERLTIGGISADHEIEALVAKKGLDHKRYQKALIEQLEVRGKSDLNEDEIQEIVETSLTDYQAACLDESSALQQELRGDERSDRGAIKGIVVGVGLLEDGH